MVTKIQGCNFQHPSTQHIIHVHTTKFHDTLIQLKVHFGILAHHPHLTSKHNTKGYPMDQVINGTKMNLHNNLNFHLFHLRNEDVGIFILHITLYNTP